MRSEADQDCLHLYTESGGEGARAPAPGNEGDGREGAGERGAGNECVIAAGMAFLGRRPVL